MTDASTRGLLPQLTEVVRALSDSHALLLSKIQTVRLEQISAAYPAAEMLGETSERRMDQRTQSLVDTTTSPIMEVPGAAQAYEMESGASSGRIVSSGFQTSPDHPIAATDAADHTVMSPAPPAEIATPRDDLVASVSVPSSLVPDGREAEQPDPTDAESENRNYNFFDELDARLAGLGDAESTGDR